MRVKIKDNFGNSTGFHAISVSQDGEILTETQGWIEIEIEKIISLDRITEALERITNTLQRIEGEVRHGQ